MTAPRPPRITAFGVSIALHAALAVLLLLYAGLSPEQVSTKAVPIRTDLVYLQQAGSGGGGGGNPAPAPPQRVEIPAHRPPAVAVEAVTRPVDPPPTLDVPVQATSTMLQSSGTSLSAPPGPGGGGKGPGAMKRRPNDNGVNREWTQRGIAPTQGHFTGGNRGNRGVRTRRLFYSPFSP